MLHTESNASKLFVIDEKIIKIKFFGEGNQTNPTSFAVQRQSNRSLPHMNFFHIDLGIPQNSSGHSSNVQFPKVTRVPRLEVNNVRVQMSVENDVSTFIGEMEWYEIQIIKI